MGDELKLLLENGGPWAALIGITWLLRPVLLAWIGSYNEGRALAERRLEAETQQAQDLAQALHGVQAQLKISGGLSNQLIDRINILPTRDDMRKLGDDVHELSNSRREWADRHDKTLDLIHADIKSAPGEAVRLASPKLDELRQSIEQYIQAMENRIAVKLDPRAENAREAVRGELTALLDRFDGIEKTLRRLEAPVRVAGSESAPTTANEGMRASEA